MSYVILLFPKHSNSRVFWCNSRRNHANWQCKTSKDLWRLWEDHEWRFNRLQKTLQRDEFFSRSQDILHRSKHPKKMMKWILMHMKTH